MAQLAFSKSAQPCVWMCAGHISYRLCTRDFDCEHCPLDAALRGELPTSSRRAALLYRRQDDDSMPADRVYSSSHTWALPLAEPDRWRIGIDAFAAALIGNVVRVSFEPVDLLLSGDAICVVDIGIGTLRVTTPLSGRMNQLNPALIDQPALVVTDPYEEGWIAEIDVDDEPSQMMLTPEIARWQLSLDVRRFRRAIAFRLLASVASRDVRAPEVDSVRDLRTIVGGADYVGCIGEFIS